MKIAFDEHVPPAVFDAMNALVQNGHLVDLEFATAKTYSPGPRAKTDIPWIQSFVDDGGDVIISGEKKMRSIPEVQAAMSETGVISFFLPRAWNSWDMATRTGFILVWMKRIVVQAKSSSAGDCWLIPRAWQTGVIKRISTETLQD